MTVTAATTPDEDPVRSLSVSSPEEGEGVGAAVEDDGDGGMVESSTRLQSQ